jgi:hypothetical protein
MTYDEDFESERIRRFVHDLPIPVPSLDADEIVEDRVPYVAEPDGAEVTDKPDETATGEPSELVDVDTVTLSATSDALVDAAPASTGSADADGVRTASTAADDPESVATVIAEPSPPPLREESHEAHQIEDSRPIILVRPGQVQETFRAAEKHLAFTGRLFQRGGSIVTVRIDPATGESSIHDLHPNMPAIGSGSQPVEFHKESYEKT